MEVRMRTNFILVMGDYPINKVLDFLVENKREAWSLREICDQSGAGYSTLKKLMPKLLKYGLVSSDRKISKAYLYHINEDNSIVQKIIDLHCEISWTQFTGDNK
jgi:predicted transcriptional regulator